MYTSTSATTAQKNCEIGTHERPSAGIPNPRIEITRMVGMPRKRSA